MIDINLDFSFWQLALLIVDYAIKIVAIGFVPENRRPSSSTAWLLAILLLPFVGLPLFLLMGSNWINGRRHEVQKRALERVSSVQDNTPAHSSASLHPEIESIIKLNRRLTGFPSAVGHNMGLHANYNQAIDEMVRAIDEAESYVYVEIYIVSWDEATGEFFNALRRAVERGVKVKLLFDQIGSWKYPGYWTLGRRLDKLGVEWRLMLPLQIHKGRFRRPDLRNHRKLVVIDGNRGFIGSQNLIKRQYKTRDRKWIDYMVELTGPIVTSIETIFAVDWYLESEEALEITPLPEDRGDAPDANILQLVPSGPGFTAEPNLRLFNSLVHHAKERLVLVSPYFVPDESLLEAVTSACYRGVRVELYVSEEADQFMVNHAQSSYYQVLLEAGVTIYQFPKPYVLHSKFMLADPGIDGRDPIAAFGSSNMDMRSFGLNYESTMMAVRGDIIGQLNELAHNYRAVCHKLTLEEWNERGWGRRYVDNVMRLTSALQ
ncbi:phospholipase D-like domain-containing protein [Corynebacterium endometrii]|uniref:Putative cardiolipin synthase YwiE n=1 Tax=Corynebacterium endometrii TaxID=2488819 RepID=A0A4P7QJZ4_9CORY|nr:putative cardiolipin synthase YwiE [Corynebacterium endometrii]